MKPTSSALLASAVASLFATVGCGYISDPDDDDPEAIVKCQGVNECRGQGKCGGVAPGGGIHGCEGLNECKGQGWIEITGADCEARGGERLK